MLSKSLSCLSATRALRSTTTSSLAALSAAASSSASSASSSSNASINRFLTMWRSMSSYSSADDIFGSKPSYSNRSERSHYGHGHSSRHGHGAAGHRAPSIDDVFGGGHANSNSKSGQYGADLSPQQFNVDNLPAFQKNLYEEHPATTALTEEEVNQYRAQHNIKVFGIEPPKPITNFQNLVLPQQALDDLRSMNFNSPSPIQAQAWPVAMMGRDLIGLAETGSGKTLAFILPALLHIAASEPVRAREGPIVLILAPVRELAQQINAEFARFNKLRRDTNLRTAVVTGGGGGSPMHTLNSGVDILVATPGRLIDLIDRGIIKMNRCTMAIVDEADRMLDMGFEPQLRSILGQIRPDRQMLLWSATWPKEVQRISDSFVQDPVRVVVQRDGQDASASPQANPKIQQKFIFCRPGDRSAHLESTLQEFEGKRILIFSSTKLGCDRLADQVSAIVGSNVVESVHGGCSQNARDRALQSFKNGRIRVLVCTDVYARGIDVKDIDLVLNYEMPDDIDSYVHRIGRTARGNNATGTSVSLFTPEDVGLAKPLLEVLTKAQQPIPVELEKLASLRSSGSSRNSYGGRGGGRGGRGGRGGSRGGRSFGGGRNSY